MTRVISLALLLAAIAACQPDDKPGSEYVYNMQRDQAYKAFAPNAGTRTGITLQKPVAGTIARGYHPFHYGKGDAEAARAGTELTDPFHPTEEVLAKGKMLFATYCQVCHGEQGKGDGPISAKIPPPPSYKSDRVMQYPPGRIFHVITMGYNKMPSYAVQVAPDERWLIATYVRAVLQGLPEASPGSNGPATPDIAPTGGTVVPLAMATNGVALGAAPAPATNSGGSK